MCGRRFTSRILFRPSSNSSQFVARSSQRTEAEKADCQAATEPWNPPDARAAPTRLHVQFAGFPRTEPLQPLRRFAPMLQGTLSRPPSSCHAPDARSLSLSREKLIQSFLLIVRDSRLRPIPSRTRRRKPGTALRNFPRSGSLRKDTRGPGACTALK